MMTIAEFCDKHVACEDGRVWGVDNCSTMQDVWLTAKPEWFIWVATREGVLTRHVLRLFAVWCCRQIWHLMSDERSKNAVEVAERYANGEASEDQLAAAVEAAWSAAGDAWDAARAARDAADRDAVAWAAAWAAARAARDAAAWDAAGDAAWDAARAARDAAAWTAAEGAARDAAMDAVRAAQAQYLRGNTNPRFDARGVSDG